jgi:hypothetical protein
MHPSHCHGYEVSYSKPSPIDYALVEHTRQSPRTFNVGDGPLDLPRKYAIDGAVPADLDIHARVGWREVLSSS